MNKLVSECPFCSECVFLYECNNIYLLGILICFHACLSVIEWIVFKHPIN